ncbi:MAG TPA: hypothetical protein VEX43_15680 [Chthoniobacterales bacterium]|nr:hypothetical protein [Chthoniobacterales bacterium]
MSKVRNRLYVIAAISLALLATGATSAHALVLDWDTAAWSDGSLINSYDLNSDAINDITVTINSQQANIWATDPATGTQTPAVNQSLTGGLVPVQNSLNLAANLKTQSNVTINLSFTGALPGAANVSFTLFDIDVTTNSDIIGEIYGVAYDGTHIAATITNVGSAVTLTGTGLNQVLTGNAAAANNSSNGNATISFGSTIITDVFFTFSNTSGAPRFQNIAIGDVSFTPVPEMNPATTAAASCIAAVVLTILLQRRARRARQAVP